MNRDVELMYRFHCGEPIRKIAKHYGITHQAVHKIIIRCREDRRIARSVRMKIESLQWG